MRIFLQVEQLGPRGEARADDRSPGADRSLQLPAVLAQDDGQEGSADLVEILEYNFVREGYKVLTATNGEKGLDLAREKRPQVVLLDLMLPGLDGVEVARKLRSHPDTCSAAIIMLTAKSEESDIVLGLGVGGTA